jgi:hypothetical protein
MGKGFVMVENLFRGHPPGEHPWHRNPFFIRKPFTPQNPFLPFTPSALTSDGAANILAPVWRA